MSMGTNMMLKNLLGVDLDEIIKVIETLKPMAETALADARIMAESVDARMNAILENQRVILAALVEAGIIKLPETPALTHEDDSNANGKPN